MSTTDEKIGSTVHRLFAVGYAVNTCLAILVSVSSGVVTDYWKDSIQGCILYADFKERKPSGIEAFKIDENQNDSDSSNDEGMEVYASNLSVCHYATFTPVFFIFVCLICATYHLRNLFFKHCWRAEESETNAEFWDMIVRVLVLVSSFMTFLALVVACVITHGHDYTCHRLRNYVSFENPHTLDVKDFFGMKGLSDDRIHDLLGRLDCGFFYSLLDFGFEDFENPSESHDGGAIRSSAIDTQAALETAMATGWLQLFCWLGLTVGNLWLANRLSIRIFPESFPIPTLPGLFNKE